LRLFSFGGYGLALAALALVVFGAIEPPEVNDQASLRASSKENSPLLSQKLWTQTRDYPKKQDKPLKRTFQSIRLS